ncbi:hypothetical protein FQN57_003842 [Myotisia sp. PD_48]|nr:hypothetical protein FQN57_003842 [Myotisia sp. PD_48]
MVRRVKKRGVAETPEQQLHSSLLESIPARDGPNKYTNGHNSDFVPKREKSYLQENDSGNAIELGVPQMKRRNDNSHSYQAEKRIRSNEWPLKQQRTSSPVRKSRFIEEGVDDDEIEILDTTGQSHVNSRRITRQMVSFPQLSSTSIDSDSSNPKRGSLFGKGIKRLVKFCKRSSVEPYNELEDVGGTNESTHEASVERIPGRTPQNTQFKDLPCPPIDENKGLQRNRKPQAHNIRESKSFIILNPSRKRDSTTSDPPLLRKETSYQELKQQKLIKKKSDLEYKLNKVEQELGKLSRSKEAKETTPDHYNVASPKKRWVPGALPSLPSERVLNQDHEFIQASSPVPESPPTPARSTHLNKKTIQNESRTRSTFEYTIEEMEEDCDYDEKPVSQPNARQQPPRKAKEIMLSKCYATRPSIRPIEREPTIPSARVSSDSNKLTAANNTSTKKNSPIKKSTGSSLNSKQYHGYNTRRKSGSLPITVTPGQNGDENIPPVPRVPSGLLNAGSSEFKWPDGIF